MHQKSSKKAVTAKKWAVVKPKNQKVVSGADRNYAGNPYVVRGIKLTIGSATNLRDAVRWPGAGKPDPYVQVKVVGKPHATFETPCLDNTKDPVWNFTHEVQHFVAGDVLKFTVYDGAQLTADDIVLGRATLVSEQFLPTGLDSKIQLEIDGTLVNAALKMKIEPLAAVH